MIPEKSRRLLVALAVGMSILSLACPETTEPPARPDEPDAEFANSTRSEPSLPPEVEAARIASRDAFTKDAVDRLRESADFLAQVTRYRFDAEIAFDVVQKNGQLLEFGDVRRAMVARPDRLRVDVDRRGGERSSSVFDGKRFSIDLPDHDAYVQIERPGTIDEVLDDLITSLDIPIPLAQFLSSNFAAETADQIESGYFVDVEQFGERWCEHFAYRTPQVDFQLWIEEGERPLPCRIVISYTSEWGEPQFTAQFVGWDLAPEIPDSFFDFVPPEGAERIPIQAVVAAVDDAQEVEE